MPSSEDRAFLVRATEASIRIGLVALLVLWCFNVVRPFIQPVLWGIILAVALAIGAWWNAATVAHLLDDAAALRRGPVDAAGAPPRSSWWGRSCS